MHGGILLSMRWQDLCSVSSDVLLEILTVSVSALQAAEMVGVCNVLQTVGDPLSLSLALDIMEEVLHSGGDPRKQGRRMARDGALAALVLALPFEKAVLPTGCLHLPNALCCLQKVCVLFLPEGVTASSKSHKSHAQHQAGLQVCLHAHAGMAAWM